MKKLIVSGFVLSTLLTTTPQLTTLSKTNNIENLQTKEQDKSIYFAYVEKYFATKTEKEKQELIDVKALKRMIYFSSDITLMITSKIVF